MAELSEEIKDLRGSLAYSILEDLFKDGSLTKIEVDLFKSKYAKVHEFVIQTHENELNFLTRAKQLNHKLMSEKIRLEKTSLESQEASNCIDQLTQQVAEVQNENEIVQDRDMMLQIQLTELEHERKEKLALLADRDSERQQEAEPKIQKMRDEIAVLQRELELMRSQKETYQQKLQETNLKCKQLEDEIEQSKESHKNYDRELAKIKADPERIKKQSEKFESAVRALQESHKERAFEIEGSNDTLRKIAEAKKEAEEQRSKVHLRLQMIAESAKITDQSCEDMSKRLAREKAIYAELMLKRVGLEQELDELNVKTRLTVAELAQMQKQFERLKRQYKRTQSGKDGVGESLGPLQSQKKDITKQLKLADEDLDRQRRLLEDIQGEVDLFIGAYLKQESLEKDKKDEYDGITQQMEEMQKELKSLKAEELQWSAHFKALASQREKLARDASSAHRLCRETALEVAMKELEEEDLRKRHQEISQKQKEFCNMYEVVKNERNKYMTHIQKSSQHLSEMKEKLKILQNEVEILQMESASKDKKLQGIRLEAQRLDAAHDQLQNEKTDITAKGTALNEQVEQYVIEIDKLNSIINSIEKEMIILRRKYEQAVEMRNFTGTQLIDRNDELCILWEKSNIQEKLLKKGEDAMMAREEERRSLRMDLQEAQRQLHVVRTKIPEVPKLVDEVVRLREQVSIVRRRTDDLSRELENPKSSMRKWQKLGGEDLDPQTLRVKIHDLEERLNNKKESLLEKELILEEVTALSEKLRQQAVDGRQGTMDLSQKANIFQSRIKDVTRKMMATVSELSMYQATAHRLQAERDAALEMATTARERFHAGMPPTDTANQEFDKMLQVETQKASDKEAAIQRKEEEDIMNSNLTRTTAEPRVNAYIPEDERGLPKAYGQNAPFKPTVLGSTMRHIRKPNPKPIEL